jgi:2-(1,2-epoxy-1,2-dihydrophenyl)acetyl-CoA isomerase
VDYQTLKFEQRDGVAHLELHRPDAANGVNLQLAEELLHATTRLADDAAVRAVLITGAGARFCGGGDVKHFATEGEGLGHYLREVTVPLHAAMSQLVRLDAPVVVGAHGSAAGAGFGIVCAADLVVAAESTKFVLAYTGIGLTPDCSSSWFLPRLVGHRRAVELTLTNRVLDAGEARDWGIVTTVVPDDDLEHQAEQLARTLAAGPTRAYGAATRLLRESVRSSLRDHLALEAETIAALASTDDAREGLAAFVQKRKPKFGAT